MEFPFSAQANIKMGLEIVDLDKLDAAEAQKVLYDIDHETVTSIASEHLRKDLSTLLELNSFGQFSVFEIEEVHYDFIFYYFRQLKLFWKKSKLFSFEGKLSKNLKQIPGKSAQ